MKFWLSVEFRVYSEWDWGCSSGTKNLPSKHWDHKSWVLSPASQAIKLWTSCAIRLNKGHHARRSRNWSYVSYSTAAIMLLRVTYWFPPRNSWNFQSLGPPWQTSTLCWNCESKAYCSCSSHLGKDSLQVVGISADGKKYKRKPNFSRPQST